MNYMTHVGNLTAMIVIPLAELPPLLLQDIVMLENNCVNGHKSFRELIQGMDVCC